VLTTDQARVLLDSIDTSTVISLRDGPLDHNPLDLIRDELAETGLTSCPRRLVGLPISKVSNERRSVGQGPCYCSARY
jgi:hypothetical protein